MFVRAYPRASTAEQDASRARGVVEAFATDRGSQIAARAGRTMFSSSLFAVVNS